MTFEHFMSEINEIPTALVRRAFSENPDDLRELTMPRIDDQVYITGNDFSGQYAIIQKFEEFNGEPAAWCELCDPDEKDFEDGSAVYLFPFDEFEVENENGYVPDFYMMFSIPCFMSDSWIRRNLRIITDIGFRVLESDETGIIFGIDGGGFSLMPMWEKLYEAFESDL